MAEVSFAKSFLSTLDSRPQKITPDHVEDPRTYPARSPYTLPRPAKQMTRPHRRAPGSEPGITVSVRPLLQRGGNDVVTELLAQPPGTSVLDIKAAVAARAGVPAARVRLLHRKKPVPDTRVLRDLVGEDGGAAVVELAFMVMGGAGGGAAPAAAATQAPPAPGVVVAEGLAGTAVLGTEEFWGDLRGFLQQRVRDEAVAEEALGRFRGAWEGRS
ncbi:hypothetical protein QBC33DRAFT_521446 [Phialemonium atrogriseum]|uniref:Ubiquitin-like domain-containing protein n=1 Tax=Phialemonium atrogriseum TaxID=1093897 RepID=A0AAJ0FRP9_9PEZI|nr:uncharacterized protein QBC33DRAFT_521446 [Phialemonium atrogriseum]KAK1772498.1 hypothetical protein QBC33DRAFT_521446 [Phialemonium atrogriseum]